MIRICLFSDNKPGHENQSLALIEALSAHRDVAIERAQVSELSGYRRALLTGRWPSYPMEQPPDIAIGAGHSTHLPLLATKRCFNTKTVVIMSPSLPARLFDARIVPEHDTPPSDKLTFVTRYALAPALTCTPVADKGLILVGGVSKKLAWQTDSVIAAVNNLINQQPDIDWIISDSRRTPGDCRERLAAISAGNHRVSFEPFNAQPNHWLNEQYKTSSQIWITEDSASMLAEALNTKATVGVIHWVKEGLGRHSSNRAARFRQQLFDQINSGDLGEASQSQFKLAQKLERPTPKQYEIAKSLLTYFNL